MNLKLNSYYLCLNWVTISFLLDIKLYCCCFHLFLLCKNNLQQNYKFHFDFIRVIDKKKYLPCKNTTVLYKKLLIKTQYTILAPISTIIENIFAIISAHLPNNCLHKWATSLLSPNPFGKKLHLLYRECT